MANPTSNFGWQMPTPVDLVTDLPADFEVFGQAVDSSLADLKGGTSGQVLSKNSNTDMDFVWVTSDDANAIQNSIVNAKGDLIGASANDTPAITSVGANGETLIADSSTSTGLRYQGSMAAGRNFVLNGGMDIWQRGTSKLDGQNTYGTADRWLLASAPDATYSRQLTGDTTNLPFIQYCMRVQRTSGSTSLNTMNISQSFETVNSIPLAGKTVTLSFYARAGANWSAASSALKAELITGTGTDQNVYTVGYTGAVSLISQNVTLTTTWQRFSITATVATNVTEIGINFLGFVTGTAGAADFYEVTGIQLEVGSVATQFTRQGGSIQGELAACQRYFQRFGNSITNEMVGLGVVNSNTGYVQVQHNVTLRTTPALTFSASGDFVISNGVSSPTSTFIGADLLGTKVSSISAAFGVVVTAGSACRLYRNGSASGSFIDFSAEL